MHAKSKSKLKIKLKVNGYKEDIKRKERKVVQIYETMQQLLEQVCFHFYRDKQFGFDKRKYAYTQKFM